ncbi:ribose transport system ATP-binding protein [Evansella vedderi]|uniref:Ribose transport system ATP-binding protein n=1 Tax=Evansella vedderi TaxID=38282 RepID=A0ABT9ZNL8_9BACI|nr:histidine kinase dimerization/phosphoacceptor domain -containing protein [Evansella vedderi]MDQ0252826.1 ribose transport system ATP-binding protein [Evansella vedderi]
MYGNILEFHDITYSNTDGKFNNLHLNLGYQEIHALIIKNSSEQNLLMEYFNLLEQKRNIKGKVIFKGKMLDRRKITENNIALLHQKPLLINNFSVAENLSLTNIPQIKFLPFINWRRVKRNAKSIIEELDFQINWKTKVKSLSNENKRIVYLAGVLLNKPEVIIMHEPMDGLSAKNAAKVYKIIKQYKEDGCSILYITKQWEEALKLADRITILSKGKITDEMSVTTAQKDPERLLKAMGNYKHKGAEKDREDDLQHVLEAVYKASEFLTSEYELKDILLLVAREATNILNSDGSNIYLIDESTGSIIDNYEFKKKKHLQTQLKKDAIINIAHENDIYYVNQNEKDFNTLFEKNNNVKTIICVPVLIRSQVTGLIQIYYENFYVYSKEEVKYLSALARHAAIAIDSTRLMGRSALLQESHHRIKNNLQSIVGLMTLQKQFVKKNSEKSITDTLDNIISRVKSIAAVHDLLSKERLGRSIINVREIIEAIVNFNHVDPDISIYLDLDDIFIPYSKASSIALIINELVTNCLKHAFDHLTEGVIHIKCKRIQELVCITVNDNGNGLPEDFDVNKLDSLGLSILHSIVRNEFKGEMKFFHKDGTSVFITFHIDKIFLHY